MGRTGCLAGVAGGSVVAGVREVPRPSTLAALPLDATTLQDVTGRPIFITFQIEVHNTITEKNPFALRVTFY